MYNDFYVFISDIVNFDKAFEITKVLVDLIDREQLRDYNFNRYGQEGEDRRPHITVRLDLENENQKTQILKKLTEMKNSKIIDDFADTIPSVKPFREYSINHHLAHETSTKCAFVFYQKKTQDEDEFQEFLSNKISFLLEFVPLWLKYSGFIFQGVNNVSESSSTLINSLAKECGIAVENVDKGHITDIHVFSERLIHTFMNCISVSPVDECSVLRNLATRFRYTNAKGFLFSLTF